MISRRKAGREVRMTADHLGKQEFQQMLRTARKNNRDMDPREHRDILNMFVQAVLNRYELGDDSQVVARTSFAEGGEFALSNLYVRHYADDPPPIPHDFPHAHRLGNRGLFMHLLGDISPGRFEKLVAAGRIPRSGQLGRWPETVMAETVKRLGRGGGR